MAPPKKRPVKVKVAKPAGPTVTVRQIKSANRKPEIQAQTLRGLGLDPVDQSVGQQVLRKQSLRRRAVAVATGLRKQRDADVPAVAGRSPLRPVPAHVADKLPGLTGLADHDGQPAAVGANEAVLGEVAAQPPGVPVSVEAVLVLRIGVELAEQVKVRLQERPDPHVRSHRRHSRAGRAAAPRTGPRRPRTGCRRP